MRTRKGHIFPLAGPKSFCGRVRGEGWTRANRSTPHCERCLAAQMKLHPGSVCAYDENDLAIGWQEPRPWTLSDAVKKFMAESGARILPPNNEWNGHWYPWTSEAA